MQAVNVQRLAEFGRDHPQAVRPLASWLRLVLAANWRSIMDVRSDYPHADAVTADSGTIIMIFNVSGNKFRLLTRISYSAQVVSVLDVLTHAEYDKQQWKRRL